MLKRMVLGFLFILVPTAAWAQTQENYLPKKSQLYFRFDGMQMHQAAFDQTAAGKMMKGDTGKFFDELWKYLEENIQTAARNGPPQVGPMLKDFTKLLGSMHQNGIVFAVEVDQIQPNPSVQAVMVFPKGATETGTLLPLINKIAEETKAPVKNDKVGKRFVTSIDLKKVKFGWWAQGEDAVLFLGTTDVVAYAKDIDSKKTGLASNPLYKKTIGFKEFKTATRGFIDVASILDVVSEDFKPAGKVIDELGVRGIKSISFVSGFDGPAERSVVDVDMPGTRKGLLSFTTQRKISLKDLPVLPNDITGFSASAIKIDKTYSTVVNLVDGVTRIFDPNAADKIKNAIKDFEGVVGGKNFDLDKELFSCFGDMLVSYSSPSDGILGTGAVVAIQLKDGKKLNKTLDRLVKAIPQNPLGQFTVKRKPYKGGELLQLVAIDKNTEQVKQSFATFGIYKNWFIYAQFPQPVKGFMLRQEGELPAWKADDRLNTALKQFPSEFTSIQVSDPRPAVQTVFAALPFVFNLANTIGGFGAAQGFQYRPFDLDHIPHAQDATRHLFPNITVTIDDGKRIRSESRTSLSFFGL
jgi:hypothetical protein